MGIEDDYGKESAKGSARTAECVRKWSDGRTVGRTKLYDAGFGGIYEDVVRRVCQLVLTSRRTVGRTAKREVHLGLERLQPRG